MNNRKSAEASIKGRRNRSQGAQFEELIEHSCEIYRQNKIANIRKTPEPIRILGKRNERGQFLACFTKKAQPDFKGTLFSGKSIVFDAKSTRSDRISVNALTDEQKADLLSHFQLGAEAGVMLCFSFKDFFYIPIADFLNAKQINGHSYWTAEDAHKQGYDCKFTIYRGEYMLKFIKG